MAPSRPLVLALHGALGSPDDWLALRDDLHLCDDDLLAWDLIGHARDDGPGFGTWTREFLSAARPLAETGRPLILLGYSLGARLALHVLERDPSLFASAVLVGAHPGLSSADEMDQRLAEDEGWAARARSDEWKDFLAAWENRPAFRDGRPVARWRPDLRQSWQRSRRLLEHRRPEVAASLECWSLGHQRSLLPALARQTASVPVLWVTGSLDAKFTALARLACAVLGSSEAVTVDGAGHRVPWEQPEAFGALFVRWLSAWRR